MARYFSASGLYWHRNATKDSFQEEVLLPRSRGIERVVRGRNRAEDDRDVGDLGTNSAPWFEDHSKRYGRSLVCTGTLKDSEAWILATIS